MLSTIHLNPFKYQFITNILSNVILKKYHNEEFVKEIEAISKLTEIPFFDMFLVNFAYELGSMLKFIFFLIKKINKV